MAVGFTSWLQVDDTAAPPVVAYTSWLQIEDAAAPAPPPPAPSPPPPPAPSGPVAYTSWLQIDGAAVEADPAAPSSVVGQATSASTATISWVDNSSNETSFLVQLESPVGSGNWVDAAGAANPTPPGVTSLAAVGLAGATDFRPRVQALGSSANSAAVQGDPFGTDNVGAGGAVIPGVAPAPAITATFVWQEVGDDTVTFFATVRGAQLTAMLAFLEETDDVFMAAAVVTSQRHPVGHYATEADMLIRFQLAELVQITNRDRKATTVDSLVLDRALSDADAEIDARLAPRYALPLQTIPRLLVNIACDIARYRLYDDRATDQVTRRYEDGLKVLSSLASGKLSLGLDAQADTTPPVDGPRATTPNRTFSASLLKDYRG